MKRIILTLLVFILAAGALHAQYYEGPFRPYEIPGPWDNGILVGSIIDFAGYASFVVGGAITIEAPETGYILVAVGDLAMNAGSLVWNIFLNQKHAAYLEKGLTVSGDAQRLSWTLFGVSVGCTAASILIGVTGVLGDWSGFVSIVIVAAGMVVEAVNMFSVRADWNNQLSAAYYKKFPDKPKVVPKVFLFRDPVSKGLGLNLGVSVAF
jgi:hypothetical protein